MIFKCKYYTIIINNIINNIKRINMILKETLEAQLRFYERMREQIRKALDSMPEGRLLRKKAGGRTYYYVSHKGKRVSLNKLPELLDTYMKKERLENKLRIVERDIPLLGKTVRNYLPVYPDGQQWAEMEPEQNKYMWEERKHLYRGVYYRSKSEAVIAMLLESYGLEFKYEVAIEVNGRTFYPDFVIRRKRDGKIILWEHFGLINDEDYRQGMFKKLAAYHDAGYDIWNNLIISFDNKNGSLDIDSIEKIITLYLL